MSETAARRIDAHRTLLAALLATVAMLFTAFAASYLERQGSAREWSRIALPGLVWVNTGVLLLSSVAAEIARRRGGRVWLGITVVCGLAFLAGQIAAWRALRAEGVYLPSSPYSSFFYILTGVHGVHVAAGLIALVAAASRPAIRGLCVGFWHFMGAAWLYVLLILKVL